MAHYLVACMHFNAIHFQCAVVYAVATKITFLNEQKIQLINYPLSGPVRSTQKRASTFDQEAPPSKEIRLPRPNYECMFCKEFSDDITV